ncbi:transcription termination/antitermination NusG family protein [Aureimonas sp. Leaf324]|uniref:transcription termination/antitermination protein NusG n=1 Tax=Aureimonas sp. Leaf324 TaxID=1736336 RepID=UPI0006F81C5B|nr:transcription termination/antitermination NusG family protein [Aureimonas sp. Leaf324]KQQ81952.1 hypothetical protein ASF65_07820 [Aureimonas sp. Leaf324]
MVAHDGEAAWFVVRTNPRCEERAAAGLLAQGFEVHLPRGVKEIRRRHLRKPQAVRFPLLTGYLFAGLSSQTPSFFALRATDGVHSVLGRRMDDGSVGVRQRYVAISGDVVRAFREMEAAGVVGSMEPGAQRFAHGDLVTVKEGPLRGVIFVFDDYFGKNAAKVLGNVCGALHPMQIDLANLQSLA